MGIPVFSSRVSVKWGCIVSTFGEGAEGIVATNMTMAVALLPSARDVAKTTLSSCKVFCLVVLLSWRSCLSA